MSKHNGGGFEMFSLPNEQAVESRPDAKPEVIEEPVEIYTSLRRAVLDAQESGANYVDPELEAAHLSCIETLHQIGQAVEHNLRAHVLGPDALQEREDYDYGQAA